VHPVVLLPFVWASERSFSGLFLVGAVFLAHCRSLPYRAPMALRILMAKK
jgi:hypothetical protein